jgi:hypothetical protein
MLDKDTAEILEKNVLKRINKMYPTDSSFLSTSCNNHFTRIRKTKF